MRGDHGTKAFMFVPLVGVNTAINTADDSEKGNLFPESLGWSCYAVAIATGSPEMTGVSVSLWGLFFCRETSEFLCACWERKE